MTSDIQPYLYPPPTRLNSSYSIREIVITTNPNVDDMMISVRPYLFYPLVGINKRPIPPKLNSPSGVRATVTPSSISTLS